MLCYHKHACEAFGDSIVDLVDYCARRLTTLAMRGYFPENAEAPKTPKEFAAELEARTAATELKQQEKDIEFDACASSLTLVRYFCEHLDDLSVSVAARVLETHDLLMLLVPAIENPPWTRRRPDGVWQKFIEKKWATVPPAELLNFTQLEAQAWLAVYHLICNPEVCASSSLQYRTYAAFHLAG